MLRRKFEYVWKFLRENNCDDAADNITDGMRCTMCRKVMINVHSASCGCRFCLGCVTDYLNGGSRFCLGNGKYCKQELMVMGETVHPDHAMNQEISRLTVKCPRDWCEFTSELDNMEDHECQCDQQATKCPYGDIGCQQSPLVNDKIDEHLEREREFHARLVMDCIGRLQNEIGAMKRNIDSLELGRREQQLEAEQQTGNIEQLNHEMQIIQYEIRLMKEQIISLGAAGETYQRDVVQKEVVEQQISEIQVRAETQAAEIKQLRQKCLLLDGNWNRFENQTAEETEPRGDLDEVCEQQAACYNMAMQVCENSLQVDTEYKGTFLWGIHNWAARRREDEDDISYVESDAFFSHEQGYRMCLSAWPDGYEDDDNFDIQWELLPGPFDEQLTWPFNGEVTVAIINQETRLDHISFTIKSTQYLGYPIWKRSIDAENDGFRNDNLISVEQLLGNPAVCADDRIFIRVSWKCTTK